MAEPASDAMEVLARHMASLAHPQVNEDYRRMTESRRIAEGILANPAPLLEALAQAGMLEVEEDVDWCDAQDEHYTAGYEPCDRDCTQAADHKGDHECVNGVSWPRRPGDEPTPRQRRLVSPWKPVSES